MWRSRSFILALASTIIIASGIADDFAVSAYLPDYRFYIDLNRTISGLTDLIMFSMDTAFSCCLNIDEHFRKVAEAKAHRQMVLTENADEQEFRVWLTVGGAGRSDGYPMLFKSTTRRDEFLGQLVQFAKRYDIDGVDFDCEIGFPDTESYKQYLKFLYHASKQLKSHGLLVSVALHPRQALPKEITVDRINLMAYDMIDPRNPGQHHARLEQVKAAVEYLSRFQPKEAILLGLPAYGRHRANPGNVKTMAELIDAGWMSDDDSSYEGFQFDSPNDIREKVAFARKEGLGGVFIWELGQDKSIPAVAERGVFVEAIHGKILLDSNNNNNKMVREEL